MKRFVPYFAIAILFALAGFLPALAKQATGVTAEAVGQANLRATPDVNAELVGQILAGTRYPVLGRSEFYPWYLLGDAATNQPMGWVFADLVTVQGNASTLPFATVKVGASSVIPSLTVGTLADSTPGELATSPTPDAPAPPTRSAAVTGMVLGEINIRYGPGTEYARLGIGQAGDRFEITGWHTQLPWLQIRYDASPDGYAWVAANLLEVQGDIYSLPSFTRTQFNFPTLTPTISVVEAGAMLGGTPVPLSPAFQALGNQVWELMLNAQFELGTSRPGALFLMDLQTREAVTFGSNIAFSGMSLNKIAILTTLFGKLNTPPDNTEAVTIAEAMICSENISSNEMLSEIGDGNPFAGALEVTHLLQTLGLEHTFITAPYGNDPFITPQPVSAPRTTADQTSADPDPFNQATVSDLGMLLGSIYQCAYDESGPLLELFPGQYDPRECRQILHTMSNNKINALFESGVPIDTRIAHKHGWIDDTHGDASIIYTPGGDYVLVAVVHNPVWMDYGESFPLLAEISRTVYNYYNPDAPVAEIRDGDGAEQCQLLGNPLIQDLMSSTFDDVTR